jgi:hypothetical protein
MTQYSSTNLCDFNYKKKFSKIIKLEKTTYLMTYSRRNGTGHLIDPLHPSL